MSSASPTSRHSVPIAIIGMACRFPGGADSPEALWTLLCDGVDAISEVPASRWLVSRFYDPNASRAGKTPTRCGGFIEGVDRFDAGFFGISPREAARMDPQQRLLLEVAWEAFEDAGQVVNRRTPNHAGVFVGVSNVDYGRVQEMPDDLEEIDAHTSTGTSYSIVANRISHALNLTGPSLAVDTACSSSLVALHLACRSLQDGECEHALAAGVNVILDPRVYVAFSRLSMLAPDGRCRAFDAAGSGFARAEGVGVVVLKTLDRALADGDPIRAVIRGTGINQDGHTPGITMPDEQAQEALVREVCRRAGVDPGDVSYVETHGPGTPVGDPIEARSLSRALCADRGAGDALILGSVKTNIGHLEPAAGISGVIKLALVLERRAIPPNLHFERPNPSIDFDRLRLRIPTTLEPWPDRRPLLGAVDSFGFGGTNAHAILEAPPVRELRISPVERPAERAEVVCLSAHSDGALSRYAASCLQHVKRGRWADRSLRDIAWTSARRRAHHPSRLCVVAASTSQLADRLETFCRGESGDGILRGKAGPEGSQRVAFVFSGQGPQWWAMGRELLDSEPVFHEAVVACDRLLAPLAGWSILEELRASKPESRMGMPAVAQPAIFCLQVALTSLWASWGVRPHAVAGHSVGEVAAAWAGGMLTLESAIRVIVHRGRCMQQVPATGRMLAVGLDYEEAVAAVAGYAGRVSIAALNSPESMTLSGDADAIAEIERTLQSRDVYCHPLAVDYAFHSHHVDHIRGEVREALRDLRPEAPRLAVYSTVTGRLAGDGDFGPDYWWRNVREPVRFSAAIAGMADLGCTAFLEVGPHPVLAGPVIECLLHAGCRAPVLHSLRRAKPERAEMLTALAALHVAGHEIEWKALYADRGEVAPFPPYCWDHETHWHQTEACREFLCGSPGSPLLGQRLPSPVPAWEGRVSVNTVPFLGDHRVHGNTLLPAAASIELALAAATACGVAAPVVENLKLHAPLFLAPDHDTVVHTRYDPSDSSCSIHGRAVPGVQTWQLHASCSLLPGGAAGTAVQPIGVVRDRFRGDGTLLGYYSELQQYGFDYGPAFRGVARLFEGVEEWLGEIVLPPEVVADLGRYHFHPAALDACLQVMARAARLERGCTYLPVEFKRVRVFGRPTPRLWSHVHHVRTNGPTTWGSLAIYADDGALIAEVEDYEAHTQRDDRVSSSAVEPLLHAYRWIRDARRRRQRLTMAGVEGCWLVLGDRGGLGQHLARALTQRGGRAVLLRDGEPVPAAALDGSSFGSVRGIVHLRSLDAPRTEILDERDLRETIPRICMDVVHTAQRLLDHEGAPVPRLWVVTRSAAAGQGLPGSQVAIGQAPVWGLGRVIANEFPLAHCTLVDLDGRDGASHEHDVDAVIAELLSDDREDEVAIRGGERYVHRYARTSLDAAWPDLVARDAGGATAGFRLECGLPGALDRLRLREAPRRPPAPGEVEIEVRAAGLNFRDVMQALGLLPRPDDSLPPLGLECAGVVSRAGFGVAAFRPGDRVLAFAPNCLASHVTVSAHRVVPMPAHLTFEAGATIPAVFATALFGLVHEADLKPGERVLIHSATGGVGLAAIQVARRIGARVFATAGTAEKRTFLERLGIEHVFDSRSLSFADEVLSHTNGEGVDVVLNSLAGDAITKGLSILRNKGRFVELGVRDMLQNRRLPMSLFRNNVAFYFVDFARVEAEQPSLITELLLEATARLEDGAFSPLPFTTFPIGQAQDAFRFMAQARHIGKIVLAVDGASARVAPPAPEDIRVRADASYVITGGLGGFGLVVAKWLAARGATRLVLAGRSGASTPEALEAVRALRDAGVTLVTEPADVTRAEDVRRLLASDGSDGRPVRGVIHAAMVLDDCLVQDLTDERLSRVLLPKALGAWHLHQLTRDAPLDFFVLFSSCSAILGLPGQANYDAANAFLDALAWQRRAQGLPATAINWGFLGEVGWAATHEQIAARFDTIGVSSFSPATAVGALGQVLVRQPAQVSVLGIDWATFLGHAASCRTSPRFSVFARLAGAREGAGGATPQAEFRRLLALGDAAGAIAVVEAAVREQVAVIAGAPAAAVAADTTLTDLGFDSLMAVEFRNWVESTFQVQVRTIDIMGGPTIHGLAERLLNSAGRAKERTP